MGLMLQCMLEISDDEFLVLLLVVAAEGDDAREVLAHLPLLEELASNLNQ